MPRIVLLLPDVDNVGTVPSAVLTYAAIEAFKPDIIINAGTAGGFKVQLEQRAPRF